ncbi:MAG TPA: PAS domain-containing sensor histidine kinase, partial [Fibrobacteria bacterium]|nr:PAS domain-containing sensor histidine kinase [Fibrobacteria bacterium]
RYLRMAAGPGPLEAFQRAAGLVFTLFLALFATSAMVITWWMSRTISTPLLHLAEHPGATPRWQAPFREAEVLNGAFERYVTEVRELAGAVSLERDRLMAVLNRLEEGILILALDGIDPVITAANPASLRLLGIDPGTLVAGRRAGEVVRPEALLRWLARAADPERTPVLHLDRGPDLPCDLLCRLGPLGLPSRPDASPGAAGMGPAEFVLTLVDITEFRHLDQVKSEFVANASHELKTPLSSLKGYAETLLEGALDNDKVRRPFVEKIQANALRLERLVQDLLHLSRLEANPVPREQEPLPLRNYVSAAAALHKHGIDSAGLRFENHVPENLRVMMEPRDLELILNNLVGNAVRYNKAGGKIKVGMVDGALYVKDTGVGIPEAMLPRIFERFYRADASRARKDGTGLGLAIVKHAAHKYGMAVRAESTLGEGSRFVVDIPEGVRKSGPVKA